MQWLRLLSLFIGLATFNCGASSHDRAWPESETIRRTRHTLGPELNQQTELPNACDIRDGLSEDEAVSIAIWRNPTLQAALTDLQVASANLEEARRPANPSLSFLAPLDPRQLALIVTAPINAIWQAPPRARAASRELERVAEALVQGVLNFERDVRYTYIDLQLADQRLTALKLLAESWAEAAQLALARESSGDISLSEVQVIQLEAGMAANEVARAQVERQSTEARLLELLAVEWSRLPELETTPRSSIPPEAEQKLVALALAQRPDLKAAELSIHASAARAHWEKSKVVSLVAVLDGKAPAGELKPDFTFGAQIEIPIFNQNQGGVGRAEAELARAEYLYASARNTVKREVLVARLSMQRALDSLQAYDQATATVEESTKIAELAFHVGDESYWVIVDALRREANVRLKRTEFVAELARSSAELSRAIGGRLN